MASCASSTTRGCAWSPRAFRAAACSTATACSSPPAGRTISPIDVRLQSRVTALLHEELAAAGLERGSVVVLDPANGEVLACVSEPAPEGPLRGTEERFAMAEPDGGPNARTRVDARLAGSDGAE